MLGVSGAEDCRERNRNVFASGKISFVSRVSRAYYFPGEEHCVCVCVAESREREREISYGRGRNTTFFTRQPEIRHVRVSFALYIYYRFVVAFSWLTDELCETGMRKFAEHAPGRITILPWFQVLRDICLRLHAAESCLYDYAYLLRRHSGLITDG